MSEVCPNQLSGVHPIQLLLLTHGAAEEVKALPKATQEDRCNSISTKQRGRPVEGQYQVTLLK